MLPQSGQDQFALVVFASPIPMASHPGIRLWKWKQAMGQQWLVGGAITIFEKYEIVNGKDDIPYMENKRHVWNHQPDDNQFISII